MSSPSHFQAPTQSDAWTFHHLTLNLWLLTHLEGSGIQEEATWRNLHPTERIYALAGHQFTSSTQRQLHLTFPSSLILLTQRKRTTIGFGSQRLPFFIKWNWRMNLSRRRYQASLWLMNWLRSDNSEIILPEPGTQSFISEFFSCERLNGAHDSVAFLNILIEDHDIVLMCNDSFSVDLVSLSPFHFHHKFNLVLAIVKYSICKISSL